jgi:hypothetical protein
LREFAGCLTHFENHIADNSGLIKALKGGRFEAVQLKDARL